MGDFFYYGQKDTIQRLNELAGRGAVVASYAPKVGMSPVGGPNGYMNPAWLDPELPIRSNLAIGSGSVAKFGYKFLSAGGAQQLIKIASMRATDNGTYAAIRVDAMIGGWTANDLTAITFVMGNRDPFNVDWSTSRFTPTIARFAAYREPSGVCNVYLLFPPNTFAQASFQISGTQAETYPAPTLENTAIGTLLWDSGAPIGQAGYISPRSSGTAASVYSDNTNGMSFDRCLEVRSSTGEAIANSFLLGGGRNNQYPPTIPHEVMRLGLSGQAGSSFAGCWSILSAEGNGTAFKEGFRLVFRVYDAGSNAFTPDIMKLFGDGRVRMPLLKAGSTDASTLHHNISRTVEQNAEILYVGRDGSAAPCVGILASDGLGGWTAALSVMYVGKNGLTGRSVGAAGTINAQGNDYAEYTNKRNGCAEVCPGQIVGITSDNEITDAWDDAILFAVKSTDPSFVGGDSWSATVGPRPQARAGAEPVQPTRRDDTVGDIQIPGTNPPETQQGVTIPGDTDAEWAVKIGAYESAMAEWKADSVNDKALLSAFEESLETARQRVDRIAIAGRVPVNVLGAQPGDYIVPVQDGAGIKGIAVREDDLSMKQYLHAVGRVISIEPDGRAYVMVKAV